MECENCNKRITRCPACGQAFNEGDMVYCIELTDSEHHRHYCEDCTEWVQVRGNKRANKT